MSPSGSSRSALIAAAAAPANPSDGQSASMPAASRSSSGGSGPQPGSRLTSERLEESGKWLRIAIRAKEGQAQPIGAEQLSGQLLNFLGGDGVDLLHHLFRGLDFAIGGLLRTDPGRHRAAVLESHQQAPLAQLLGATQLVLWNSLVAQFTQLPDQRLDGLLDTLQIGARRQHTLPDVGVRPEVAEDRVDETALLANLLEETRAHSRGENGLDGRLHIAPLG